MSLTTHYGFDPFFAVPAAISGNMYGPPSLSDEMSENILGAMRICASDNRVFLFPENLDTRPAQPDHDKFMASKAPHPNNGEAWVQYSRIGHDGQGVLSMLALFMPKCPINRLSDSDKNSMFALFTVHENSEGSVHCKCTGGISYDPERRNGMQINDADTDDMNLITSYQQIASNMFWNGAAASLDPEYSGRMSVLALAG